MSLPSDWRRLRRPLLVAALGSATLAALPSPAAAKTFVASFKDKAGDAELDGRDVVQGRVAYNRKSGALSATVRMQGDLLEEESNAVVVVAVSDLTNGKCTRVRMSMGVTVADPSVPVAFLGDPGSKRQRLGAGSIEGDTLKMRVKAKLLAGQTPGCTFIYVIADDDKGTILDTTPIENGFA